MSNDYDVGYGRPPKATRFEPGKSGNPKGRPKGSKSLKSCLAAELTETITIKEGGKTKTITKQHATIKALVALAIKGNVSAIAKLNELTAQLLPEMIEVINPRDMSAEDLKILGEYKLHLLAELKAKKRKKGQS